VSIATRDVPFNDLYGQYRSLRTDIDAAIASVIERSAFIQGPEVAEFEREFAAYCDAYAHVAMGSGTDALHMALVALGVGPGDEVVTQANTFVATLEAIAYTGATIVLVDVAPPHFDIDVAAVAAAITPRTKVLLPVHLFGQPAQLDSLRSLATRNGLAIIEDASQAHGARYRGRRIGSEGTAVFSFYPGKNLGAYGEGGGVTTGDPKLSDMMRVLRDHGSREKYQHEVVGYNYRMDGIQAAVLRVKLKHLDRWNDERRRVARAYDGLLAEIMRPSVPSDVEHVYHIYPVFVQHRERIAAYLRDHGIQTNVHYPVPCHLQPAFAHLGYRAGAFPNCERMAREELSLPIYPELSDDAAAYVAQTLLAALKETT
jgi:dTDP-4-amino-4,6-dideoxygalactose transaminase